MLVDAADNARNRNSALMIAGVLVSAGSALTWFSPWGLVLFPIAASVFYALRRKTLRRLRVISQPFPEVWEATLESQVEYFRGLEPDQQERFRNLMKVFLDEVTANEYIDDYAFTNEAEYFAVLSEYFFEAPESLERKNPKLYEMMQKMYHQNPKRILNPILSLSGRSAPCGCAGAQASRHSCERRTQS